MAPLYGTLHSNTSYWYPTTNEPSTARAPTPQNTHWSLEALFGLLGILAVIFVPCVGLLIRCTYIRWRNARGQKAPPRELITSKCSGIFADRD
jgi:hypothetical protein